MKNLFSTSKSPLTQMTESLGEYSDPCASFGLDVTNFSTGLNDKKEDYLLEVNDVYSQGINPSTIDPELDNTIDSPELADPEDDEVGELENVPFDQDSYIDSPFQGMDRHDFKLQNDDDTEIDSLNSLFNEPEFLENSPLRYRDANFHHLPQHDPEGYEGPLPHHGVESLPYKDHTLDGLSDEEREKVRSGDTGYYESLSLADKAAKLLEEEFGGEVKDASGQVNGVDIVKKYQDPATGEVFVKATDGRIFCVTVGFGGNVVEVKRTSFNPVVPEAYVRSDKDAINALGVSSSSPRPSTNTQVTEPQSPVAPAPQQPKV